MVFGVSIIIRSLIRKEYSELWRYIKWFIVGVFCVAAPLVIWLVVNGAFDAFVSAYIGFNISYSVGGQVNGIISTALYFIRDIIILLSCCLVVFMAVAKKKERFMMIVYVVTYVVCILTACMSGRISPHYGMVLVPLVVFPFAVFCQDLDKGEHSEAIRAFVLMLLVSLTFTSWLEVVKLSTEAFHREVKNSDVIASIDNICEDINKNTDSSDRISVFGNWNYIYLRCNRLPASKYSYQFPIGEIQPAMMDEYFDEIEKARPKIFVVQAERWNEKEPEKNNKRAIEFVETNGYVEAQEEDTPGFRVYVLGGSKNGY